MQLLLKRSIVALALVGVLLLGSACVSTQSVVDRFGEEWIGKNFDEFVLRYGTPYKRFELQSGDVVYTWNSGTVSMQMPTSATTNVYGNTAHTQVYGGGNIDMFCEMQFVTNPKGIITEVTILKDTVGFWVTSRCHEVLGD